MRNEWSLVRRIFSLILKHCDSLPLLQHVLCYNDCNTAPSEQTGLCCSVGVSHHTDYSVNNFASALEKREIWDLYVWTTRVNHSLFQAFRLWDDAKRCEQEKWTVPPPKSRLEKWRVFALRAASTLIWGDVGLLFHFILSKIVACLRAVICISVAILDGWKSEDLRGGRKTPPARKPTISRDKNQQTNRTSRCQKNNEVLFDGQSWSRNRPF